MARRVRDSGRRRLAGRAVVSCAPWDLTGCAGDVAKAAAGDAFSSIAHDFANMADSGTNWLWGQMGTATAVHLGGAGFSLDIGIVLAITATVALGLFLIQIMASVLRRDAGGLARAAKGLVVAFIGGGIAVAVTNLLLVAIDSLCNGVVQAATSSSLSDVGHSVLAKDAITSATANPAGLLLLSLAALLAVAIVWVALMVRKVLIVVSAVFAPLAFAGSLADITISWTRRWIETMAALILAKLVLVIIFVVGLGMLVDGVGQAGTGKTQVATQTVCGVLVLALAGFAPWLALKLVHFSGDQFHHLHAMAANSTAGIQRAAQAPQKMAAAAAGNVVPGAARRGGTGAAPVRSAGSGVDSSTGPRPGGTSGPSLWPGVPLATISAGQPSATSMTLPSVSEQPGADNTDAQASHASAVRIPSQVSPGMPPHPRPDTREGPT